MSVVETRAAIEASWKRQEVALGYTSPHAVAADIVGNLQLPETWEPALARAYGRFSTKEYVYPGAEELIRELLGDNQYVVFWTQGDPKHQAEKVVTSGLTEVRRGMPREYRSRLSLYASLDKTPELPDLLTNIYSHGIRRVIIVDDKAKNIQIIEKGLKDWSLPPGIEVKTVWANQGRTKNEVPKGYSLSDFIQTVPSMTIDAIDELRQRRHELIEIGEPACWLLDVDHTLIESKEVRSAAFNHLAYGIEIAANQSIPPEIAFSLDRHLREKLMNQPYIVLNGGISGGHIAAVGDTVIKYNVSSQERIRGEIAGQRFLIIHGFDKVNPDIQLIPSLQDQPRGRYPFVVMPLVEGTTLNDLIKSEKSQQSVKIINTILEAKKKWWADNKNVNQTNDSRSMQRLEWSQTCLLIPVALQKLEEYFGIDAEKFAHLPLSIGGYTYPSLSETVAFVSNLLSNPPPYTRPCHGDLSPNNIIVDGKTIHITDGEWAGHSDPAEALVRIIKQESSRVLHLSHPARAEVRAGSLKIDMAAEIPESARQCQLIGMEHLADFATLLQDNRLQSRFNAYMAGSYLRELALGPRRLPDPQMLLYPIIQAASYRDHSAIL